MLFYKQTDSYVYGLLENQAMVRIDDYGYQELKYDEDDNQSQSNRISKLNIRGGFIWEDKFCFLTSNSEILIDNLTNENYEKFTLKLWKSKVSG
jgi:hypothetical protein